MRFHAQRVFASAARDYFQLLLGPEESDEKEFDPYEESGPYLLVQRQFEMPDRGRCYIETHDEGYIYHSLQVFHLAREARPYDEEFLLAALLHDVGKALDSQDHADAGVEALRGAVTERTLWLIGHHMDLLIARERGLSARLRRELEASEYLEDLKLLRELDDAGRVPGMVVETLDEVLAYIKGLEHEAYLEP